MCSFMVFTINTRLYGSNNIFTLELVETVHISEVLPLHSFGFKYLNTGLNGIGLLG
jgi:hypothetical protein